MAKKVLLSATSFSKPRASATALRARQPPIRRRAMPAIDVAATMRGRSSCGCGRAAMATSLEESQAIIERLLKVRPAGWSPGGPASDRSGLVAASVRCLEHLHGFLDRLLGAERVGRLARRILLEALQMRREEGPRRRGRP